MVRCPQRPGRRRGELDLLPPTAAQHGGAVGPRRLLHSVGGQDTPPREPRPPPQREGPEVLEAVPQPPRAPRRGRSVLPAAAPARVRRAKRPRGEAEEVRPRSRPGLEAGGGVPPPLMVAWRRPRPGPRRGGGLHARSVDAPEPVGTVMWRSGPRAYLRLHGRSSWYSHDYSRGELEELARMLLGLGCGENYVFFNNDHAMLANAREMKSILAGLGCGSSGGRASSVARP